MRIRAVVGLSVAAMILTVSCSTKPTESTIVDQSSSMKSATKQMPKNTSDNQTSSNNKIEPCSLLSPAEGAELIGELIEEPYYRRIATAHTCAFQSQMITSRVIMRYATTFSDMKATNSKASEIAVNGRRGIQVDAGTCGVILEIISGGSFEVTTTHQNENEACPIALKIAEFIEPRLPR